MKMKGDTETFTFYSEYTSYADFIIFTNRNGIVFKDFIIFSKIPLVLFKDLTIFYMPWDTI